MSNKIIIAPSMLSCDLSNSENESKRMISSGADWLHMDIMDGVFVPNLTFGFPVLESIRKKVPDVHLDCHLMIVNPKKWVNQIVKTANSISFHIEACHNQDEAIDIINQIKLINQNIKVGIALNPDTSLVEIIKILEQKSVDYVLVMTVNPGFSGQQFYYKCLDKISSIRKNYPYLDIQVDGGINLETFKLCRERGANIFVSGSTIFKHPSPEELIKQFKTL